MGPCSHYYFYAAMEHTARSFRLQFHFVLFCMYFLLVFVNRIHRCIFFHVVPYLDP